MSKSAVLACLLGVAAVVAPGCRKPRSTQTKPSEIPAPDFDRQKLLTAFGECAVATNKAFDAASIELKIAVAKLQTDASEANRTAARAAWEKAIDAWQQAEVMQFGPAAESTVKGGRGLRADIYYPPPSRCAIDQVTAAKSWEEAGFMSGALPGMRGLGALEYLLFYEGTDHGCTSITNWSEIAGELSARKSAFGAVLAADVSAKSAALLDAWDPSKGKFMSELTSAGNGSTLFPRQQDALNAVSDAIFYLEFTTKDDKLGHLLDINVDCDAGTCCASFPCYERLESRYAKRSKQHLRNNLIGFRKILTGCGTDYAGLGFDDLLTAIGAGSLAEEMDADVVAAIAVIDAFPYATLDEGLAKDPASVRKIYDAIKQVTDALKTEFKGILSFTIPQSGPGDAD
jgi:predicted lipoprotein